MKYFNKASWLEFFFSSRFNCNRISSEEVEGSLDDRHQRVRNPSYLNDKGEPDWENHTDNWGAIKGTEKETVLDIGALFDRYGSRDGVYVGEYMTPYEQRSLPYIEDDCFCEAYRVVKPISGVTESTTSKAFDQPGCGTQYKLPYSVQWLLDNWYIEVIYKGY